MDNGTRPRGLKGVLKAFLVWFRQNQWARTGLTVVLIVAPMALLVRNLIINWGSLQEAAIQIRWGRMGFTLLILLVGFGLLPLGTLSSLRALGSALSFSKAYYAYHASQLGKYLPGRIWIIPGRAVIMRGFGVDPILGGAGALLETYLLIVTGVVAFLPYMFLVPRDSIRQLAIIGMILSFPALLILFFPKLLNWLLGVFMKWLKRPAVHIAYSWKQIVVMLGVYLGFWFVSGTGFYILIDSFYPLNGQAFLQIVGVLGFSWVVGFISFLTPAGIGVREGAMGFLLAPLIPDPFPALIAIASRIWWSLADLASIGAAFLFFRTKRD